VSKQDVCAGSSTCPLVTVSVMRVSSRCTRVNAHLPLPQPLEAYSMVKRKEWTLNRRPCGAGKHARRAYVCMPGPAPPKKVRVKPNVPAMKYSDGTTYKYKGVNYVAKKFAVWKPVPQKKKGMKTVVLKKKVVAPAKRAPTAAEKKRLDKIKAATAATAFKNAEVLTRRRAAQEKRAAAVAEKMKGPNAVNATSAFLKRLGGR